MYGASRYSLAYQNAMVQADRSERYFSAFSYRLTPTDGSLRVKTAVTSSHHCVFVNILTEMLGFVKQFHTVCNNPLQVVNHTQTVRRFGIGVAATQKTKRSIKPDRGGVCLFDAQLGTRVFPLRLQLAEQTPHCFTGIALSLMRFVDQKLRKVVASRLVIHVLHQHHTDDSLGRADCISACPLLPIGIGSCQDHRCRPNKALLPLPYLQRTDGKEIFFIDRL